MINYCPLLYALDEKCKRGTPLAMGKDFSMITIW